MNRWTARVCLLAAAAVFATAQAATAAEWFVAPGGTGNGTSAAPFGRIQDALNAARPGDIVTVRAGTYTETLRTIRGGLAGQPIRVRAAGSRGTSIVTYAGRVLRVDHPYITVEGLVLDGQYGAADTVLVASAAHYLTLRNLEVRRSSRDLIDIRAPTGVLIDGCLIHRALNAANGRTDAHGIVAGAARDLTIRGTEIHTFSGDGFQIDPGRNSPGWDRVTLERSRIWLAPLAAAENGFAAGVVPGENAVDTKASATLARAALTIRDTVAWGFRGGLISNMAAFNLKEHVSATVDRVTVYNSEIAFRLRGAGAATTGAWVTVKNAVVYDTATAFRYEDDIKNLKIWNSTVGRGVARAFRAASSGSAGVEARNLLVLGSLPAEASHASNKSVGTEAFVNAGAHNYALARGSAAVDAGITLAAVATDRAGTRRPQGAAYDVGAYEQVPEAASGDIVRYAAKAPVVSGGWRVVADAAAAGGSRLWHPDAGSAFAVQPFPTHYFELQFWAEAGRAYRLWLRGIAQNNYAKNDSVYVQFSGAIDAKGRPAYAIGSTSATQVRLIECSSCGLSGWGWQDNGYGLNVLGPLIRFAQTGLQTIRVQTMEDGVSLDQVVLSPSTYLTAAPGAAKNDATILPES